MMFFKGTPSEKKYSQDNFRGIHIFFKIPIVKVLFSNLLSKKGMSYVTYPVKERDNMQRCIRNVPDAAIFLWQ
jgi:hypothetical protein